MNSSRSVKLQPEQILPEGGLAYSDNVTAQLLLTFEF
jgi:hypothetical protein